MHRGWQLSVRASEPSVFVEQRPGTACRAHTERVGAIEAVPVERAGVHDVRITECRMESVARDQSTYAPHELRTAMLCVMCICRYCSSGYMRSKRSITKDTVSECSLVCYNPKEDVIVLLSAIFESLIDPSSTPLISQTDLCLICPPCNPQEWCSRRARAPSCITHAGAWACARVCLARDSDSAELRRREE